MVRAVVKGSSSPSGRYSCITALGPRISSSPDGRATNRQNITSRKLQQTRSEMFGTVPPNLRSVPPSYARFTHPRTIAFILSNETFLLPGAPASAD
ncbi:hypothetical protein HETIRDRAFT_100276 [Heterobasidion irregulare TC 32-1]|uniref:Uncharacterized protein n=1 Tax=Heterobasidion irregulare (strain TC 32-1) TaxID=747525 RepID=W4KK14_HETIT|nr:uncharacterized protein HETIRDRAFT_100276 [Heterobasidion irregulare TC 32-1]ETW86203.1 hypothetical protein HETIRDRAFT_100276 [Heterobasidion irregulare TC 32-1]